MPGPLEGIRVFDLTAIGVGPWSTMILAALGANVIKIDDVQNWTNRQGGGPLYQGLSVVYMHCQLGKKAIFLDLKAPQGQKVAWGLLKNADVFAENMKWGAVGRLGLSYEAVSKINPGIVYANCPGWGSKGPFKDLGSGDSAQQTFAGAVAITGKRGGEGEFIRWYAYYDFLAGAYIAAGTLFGLLHRERSGNGLRIESSQLGASVAHQSSRIAEFLAMGEDVPRMGSACTTTVPHRAFLCQDKRWLAVGVITDQQWLGLCKALKDNDLLEDKRFATNPGRVQHRDELEGRLRDVFATQPARWWVIQLRRERVPVSLFYDYETIPDLEQVEANRCIVPIKYPRLGTLPFGNIPFQLSKTPVTLRPGPWPGQDTEKVVKEGWGKDGAPKAKGYFGPTGPMERGVLDGVTVVDMTQGLAGPYASLLLADAGARVIKMEPPEGDYARGWGPPMVDGVSAVFFHLNRNKEGIRFNIRKKGEREKLLELLKTADVFIEDVGQAKLKRLGLSYKDLEKANPGLVCCSITPFGTRGPLRNQPASELVVQAMSDWLNNLGVAGEEPVRMGPDAASLSTSIYAIHGITAALYHKWRTGEGQLVTVNMLATLIHLRGVTWSSVVDPDTWQTTFLFGYMAPPEHGYKTADRPIMPSAPRDQEKLHLLLKSFGMDSYLIHPIFQNSARDILGQGNDGSTLREQAKLIWEAAFKKYTAEEVVNKLNSFDSRAVVVNTYGQLVRHPQIEALNMFKELDHPSLGKLRVLGWPWLFDGVPMVSPEPFRESAEGGEVMTAAREKQLRQLAVR